MSGLTYTAAQQDQAKTVQRVVLCADDYGLSPAVSRGIRDLLQAGRLSATSCMVVYADFEHEAEGLKPFFGKADIGLHFTLTADRPVKALMRDAYARRLDAGRVAAELEHQIATFAAAFGRMPDYIDGHQHVHLLPTVRDAVVKAAQRIGAYVRSTAEPVGLSMARRPSPVEAAFLSWTARPLRALIRQFNLKTNRGFRGVRTFRETAPYRDIFLKMAKTAQHGCLIMCHPGEVDGTLKIRDRVWNAREGELRYLASKTFESDLAEAGLILSRLEDALPIR